MASAEEPFRPLVRELQRLDDEDPQLAAQAARLVGLYRRLWESYVAKGAESQRLSEENRQMNRRYAEQEALLFYFREAFQKVREGITMIFESWKDVEPRLPEPSQDGPVRGEDPPNKP